MYHFPYLGLKLALFCYSLTWESFLLILPLFIERNSKSIFDVVNGRFKLSLLKLTIGRLRIYWFSNNKKCTNRQFFGFNKSDKNIKCDLTNKIITVNELTRVKCIILTNINLKKS
jgi:hypothetical protein